jgi:hypothetical protein
MEAVNYRKSSYSSTNGGNCVAVGHAERIVRVMDTKDADGPKLAVHTSKWAAFTRRIQRG